MLDKKHIKAIDLLLDGRYTQEEIAEKVGVRRNTLWLWRTKNEEFKKYYNDRLQIQKEIGNDKFTEKVGIVTDELLDIIENPETSDTSKVQAITYWLNRVYGTPVNAMEIETRGKTEDTTNEEDILEVFDDNEE